MRKTFKDIPRNLSLLILVLLLIYFFLEFIVFRFFLIHLPLRFHGYLPDPIYALAQNSKAGTIPQNYIAIFGDSYAVGDGDWVRTANAWLNRPFASQHLLHQKLGRDVIVIGKPGTGSVGSLIVRPINFYRYLNSTLFYQFENPKIILAYFYEGNDLNNNLYGLRKNFPDDYDINQIYNRGYFKNIFADFFIQNDSLGQRAKSFRWHDNLFFFEFIKTIFLKRIMFRQYQGKSDQEVWNSSGINKVLVKGEVKSIPDYLHGPALELSDDEINLSLYIFKESLAYLSNLFLKAKIFVVYVPSVLSCYQIVSPKVSIHTYQSENHIFSSEMVVQRSNLIGNKIKQITEAQGLTFIDARKVIKKSSEDKFIHGPVDWRHFNRNGYEALAQAIVPFLVDAD